MADAPYLTYTTVGIREDLSDVIFNVDFEETPFVNMVAGTGDAATQPLHEWQTDTYATADTGNAKLEGADKESTTVAPTVRLNNYCQISDKVFQVSRTNESSIAAGRGSELDYQAVKKGVELRRDMEAILLSNQAKNAGNASTARNAASVLSWINTNTSKGATGTDPTGDGTDARGDGTLRTYTEDLLKEVLASLFNKAGTNVGALYLMQPPLLQQVFSGFTGRADQRRQVEESTIVQGMEVYVSDFGYRLSVVPSQLMRTRDVLGLSDRYWAISYLNGASFLRERLAKTGDSTKEMIISEYTLESRNQGASFGVYDVQAT